MSDLPSSCSTDMLKVQFERLLYLKLFLAMTPGCRSGKKSNGSPFGSPARAVDFGLSGMPVWAANQIARGMSKGDRTARGDGVNLFNLLECLRQPLLQPAGQRTVPLNP